MFNFFKKSLTQEQLDQVNQLAEKFKKNPHQFRFTVLFFFTSLLFGGLTIYLLQQKFALMLQKNGKVEIKEIIRNVPMPFPEVTLEPTKEATGSANPGKGETTWTLKKNENCNVVVPVSPYQEENEGIKRNWMTYSMFSPQPFLNIFDQTETIRFENTEDDTSSSSISIYCANNQGKTSLIDLRNEIDRQLASNASLQEVSILSSIEKNTWGKESLELIFSGGGLDGKKFYAVTTAKHFYLVSKEVNSSDEVVRQDAERIFHGLLFLD